MTMSSGESDLRLPPERFYWAVLDGSITNSRARLSNSQLRYLFEPLLPVPLAQVHAVFLRLNGNRVLACGVEKRVLEQDVPVSTVSCGPRTFPSFVETTDAKADADSVNLLTGGFAPPVVRGLRRSVLRRTVTFMLLCCLLLLIGIERRTASLRADANVMRADVADVYDYVLGPAPADQVQPRDVQFVAELRRLQRTRATDESSRTHFYIADVTQDLAALLSRWPDDIHLRTESIAVTPSTITIRADLPTPEASAAIAALERWGAWKRDQPEISNRTDTETSTLTMRFRREEGAAPW